MKHIRLTAALLAAVLGLTACGGNAAAPAASSVAETTAAETDAETPIDSSRFVPRYDTDTTATLEIASFMGNYEALDQVMNAFNEIYPNVQFNYDHNSIHMLNDYVKNNAGVDIFMVSDQNLNRPELTDDYVADYCLDLSQEDLNLAAIRADALDACKVDGRQLRIPVAMNPCGIVVNKTLLKNAGLSMPTNYEEFMAALAALKDKGYTPIQGSEQHVYTELVINMAMDTLMADDTLLPALQAGDAKAVEAMTPVFEKLGAVIDGGYTDYALNSTFGTDNYDSTIMAFFEGNMPFYVCNAECFSGMKKRESKSETYSANPFEYEFLYAPLGDNGVYAYTEPWYGFAVNKDADEKEMAVEFLRFMTCTDQIEKMASIKGMPAVNVDAVDERYPGIKNIANVEADYAADGTIPGTIWGNFAGTCIAYGAGDYAAPAEAAAAFVAACKQ